MARSIRDFEESGKIYEIMEKTRDFEEYNFPEALKWIPIDNRRPDVGQRVLACKHNDFRSWVDVVYYAEGMFFGTDWSWASEANTYDAWMYMPLPIYWKEPLK